MKPEPPFDPDDLTTFAWVPGRYYVAMFCIPVPPPLSVFGNGADITGMLWRKHNEPMKWTFQWRFRQYAQRGQGAWGTKDTRNWYATTLKMNEARAFEEAKVSLGMIAAFGGTKLDVWEIRGDHVKFAQLPKPSWLHVGVSNGVAQVGGDPKGN